MHAIFGAAPDQANFFADRVTGRRVITLTWRASCAMLLVHTIACANEAP
jgi:hypothetical protein